MVHSTKSRGDVAEGLALDYLRARGLQLLERNFKTTGRGGGEVDLIMQDKRRRAGAEREGTLVFVEVRRRSTALHGGAAGSVSQTKKKRLIFAAQCYLLRYTKLPPCRFDVVAIDGAAGEIEWIEAAFDGGV